MPEYTIHNPDPTRPPDTIYLGTKPVLPTVPTHISSLLSLESPTFVDSVFMRPSSMDIWLDYAGARKNHLVMTSGFRMNGHAVTYAIKSDAVEDIRRLINAPGLRKEVLELLRNHLEHNQTTTVENYEL